MIIVRIGRFIFAAIMFGALVITGVVVLIFAIPYNICKNLNMITQTQPNEILHQNFQKAHHVHSD